MGQSIQEKEILEGLHRRFEVRMHVSGDTWEDLQRLAREFARAVEERSPDCLSITSGGYSNGGFVFAVEDPEMTHERWEEDLQVYLDRRKEATQ